MVKNVLRNRKNVSYIRTQIYVIMITDVMFMTKNVLIKNVRKWIAMNAYNSNQIIASY